ncbi:hypothetical protein [Pseudomonas sp. TTU2014-080ASC]|uniref:hypothetical protein n=1 Tax=Pseudomonas sp. TTU2014-080ASC TaxID=1729724 RepID=UPI0007187C47|nr:hypothetical protein [Pseudomonas sp. TTU2014-080ASC]KRW58566.1 hypothetical protein AO726_17160 [Pseudomonas sp. TTU2014-080ASC]
MSKDYCFATLGQLVKLAYDAFGVLPRKEACADDLDESQKKAIQKQLSRLAKEEGGLLSNLGEAIKILSYTLTAYIPSPEIMGAVGETFNDLLEGYNGILREEGTYLSKLDTIRHFVSLRAVPLLVISIQRSLLESRLPYSALKMPSEMFWYLPTFNEDGGVEMPLEKVMRWAYRESNLSQTQFHYPGKSSHSENFQCQQRLDSATRWAQGRSLPALPVLFKNFKDSFAAQAEHGQVLPEVMQISVLVALLVARVSTYLSKRITEIYGHQYLADVCQQLTDYTLWITEEVNEFKAEMEPVMLRQETPESAEFVWGNACYSYWNFFGGKLASVADTVRRLQEARPGMPLRHEVVAALKSKYGLFAVGLNLDLLERQSAFVIPDEFAGLLYRGFDLKKDPTTQMEQIDEYASAVAAHGFGEQLCWMEPWLRGVCHYRREEFEAAMPYLEQAFENAKYRAGKSQYDLVNQYVEVAAKNDNRRAFKKGIEWAQYLDIKIRWLRDDEPTEEKLDYVYYMLKMARYDHQM